jgi:mannose-6-phosphate isomerase-like protein (cupin superfamily)
VKTFQIQVSDELAREIETSVRSGSFKDAGDFFHTALKEFVAANVPPQVKPPRNAYEFRKQLLESAWSRRSRSGSERPALTVPALAEAMRQSRHSAQPSTSLYFAGADVDHPYFLHSEALGIGIAVLPEDAEKAKVRKRHPHQAEVMFVLDGGLCLHIEGRPPLQLRKGEHYVIEKNVCHWVTPLENEPGVFAFVKTNPALEPRGVLCDGLAPAA